MQDDKAYRKVIIMKIASVSCLLGGFMLLWLVCVYAAQIKYEYFYDQQQSVFIGNEVHAFDISSVVNNEPPLAQNQFGQGAL